jgi:hypothetical protein
MEKLPDFDPAFAIRLNAQSVVDLAEGAAYRTPQGSDTPPFANTHTEEGSAREDFAPQATPPRALASDVAPSAPASLESQRARAAEAQEVAAANWFAPLE